MAASGDEGKVKADPVERASDVIAAPGWAAVYLRDGREFAWPLVAWLRPAAGGEPPLVGLTISPDGKAVVRADQVQGFKCYLPPAEWIDETAEPGAPGPKPA